MSILFNSFKRPGVKVVEQTAGYRPIELSSFQAVYIFGSATSGAYLTPTQVKSQADFTNQFANSPSENAVKLYFRNDRQGVVYFVRTPIAARKKITISTAATGAYTVTVNGTDITATATSGSTTAQIATLLTTALNTGAVSSQVTASAGALPEEIIVYSDDPEAALTLIQKAGGLTVANIVATTPTAIDYAYAIENTFDYEEDWAQGFILAPEAFQLLTVASDRLAVGNAMIALASSENFDWFAILDCGLSTTTNAQLQTEGQTYVTPKGHGAYYAPYVTDLEDQVVPPSAAIAGIATRRFREEGFHQPMAGAKYPILGAKDVVTKYTNQDQEVLNPLGINLIRNLRNKGVVAWAMRTRSSDEFYKQTVTRIIMNVLNGTLRRAFDSDLFTSIDGQGVLLTRIEATARSVCRRLWLGRALFGNSPEEAFEVVASFVNNTPEDLEAGNVLLEVYVAPSPAVERILISTIRVGISQVQASAQAGTQL